MQDLILASKSPRRAELLRNVGFSIRIVPSNAKEDFDKSCSFGEIVMSIAQNKAADVAEKIEGIILAADTVVVFGKTILGKPKTGQEACLMLSTLSGGSHEVYTGVCIQKKDKTVSFYEKTRVYFKELSNKEINGYIKTGEPFDKAGGYGIQQMGAMFIKGIEGDYFNVVGLPLCRTCHVLKEEFGLSVF